MAISATVTANVRDKSYLGSRGWLQKAQIVLDNDTYSSGGISLSKGNFGFKRQLLDVIVVESDVSGFRFEFDQSASKLRIITKSITTGSTAATGSTSDGAAVVNASGDETSVLAIGAATSTAYDLGPDAEVAAGLTLPAITLQVEAIGQ